MVEPSFQAEMAMAMDNHDDNDSFQKIKGALFEPYDGRTSLVEHSFMEGCLEGASSGAYMQAFNLDQFLMKNHFSEGELQRIVTC